MAHISAPNSKTGGNNALGVAENTNGKAVAAVRHEGMMAHALHQMLACKNIDTLIANSERSGHSLRRSLGPWSITALGIGAIIGAGIFVLTGTAAAGEHFEAPSILHAQVMDILVNTLRHNSNTSAILLHGRPPAGPAIAVSFLLVALVCSFAGMCYAELAAMIPIAGSAYTYAYAILGEFFAWIIGWDLILEYAVGSTVVAIGFSAYLKAQLAAFGVHLPELWSTPVLAGGVWTGSYFNVPAFLVVFILTMILVRGVSESSAVNNVIVLVKLGAIVFFLAIGATYVKPANWTPFAPGGVGGIVTGGAIIFFTYIGFDTVSTAAEEARRPQRDLPIGIIGSLCVCTVLYVGVAIVLLGMMPYSTFVDGEASRAPVAYSLRVLGASRVSQTVIIVGALMGMVSSMLVMQYGQARIWYAMSRDGLFPKFFSRVHPTLKTPHVATLVAGGLVGVCAGVFSTSDAADMTNIGTLFAFVLVSLGVLVLRRTQPDRHRPFRCPLVPVFPLTSIVLCVGLMTGLTLITWVRFAVWLAIGLVIYALYSRHRSEFAAHRVHQAARGANGEVQEEMSRM